MTALNIAIAHDRALLVTDEHVAKVEPALAMSKLVALPHVPAVLAVTGAAGLICGAFKAAQFRTHAAVPRLACVAEAMPGELRAAYAAGQWRAPTTIYLVGMHAAGTVGAWEFRSLADFEPEPLPVPLVRLYPVPGVIERETAQGTGDSLATDDPPSEDWPAMSRLVLDAIHTQNREQVSAIGGRVQVASLERGRIVLAWGDELPDRKRSA